MREVHPSMNFPPPSIPSPSFRDSGPEAKRALDSNTRVEKGTPSNAIWSSASVTRRAVRTLASFRRAPRTSGVASWRKMISGDFGPLRIWSRMSLARTTGREEKASMFHDTRERGCVQGAWMFDEVRVGLCATGMGAHAWVERLKTERVRKNLLAAMGGVLLLVLNWERLAGL